MLFNSSNFPFDKKTTFKKLQPLQKILKLKYSDFMYSIAKVKRFEHCKIEILITI